MLMLARKRREREIVQRDWVVADLISQFCRYLEAPRGFYLDIIYEETLGVNKSNVCLKIGGWPNEILLEFDLQKWSDSSKATVWQVIGMLKIVSIRGPARWPDVQWFLNKVVADDKAAILYFYVTLENDRYIFTRKK